LRIHKHQERFKRARGNGIRCGGGYGSNCAARLQQQRTRQPVHLDWRSEGQRRRARGRWKERDRDAAQAPLGVGGGER
jgi:hypothetical protein